MKTVSITFVGDESDHVAETFYTWIVDGGMEDQIVQMLTELTNENIEVDSVMDINNETLSMAILSKAKTS